MQLTSTIKMDDLSSPRCQSPNPLEGDLDTLNAFTPAKPYVFRYKRANYYDLC